MPGLGSFRLQRECGLAIERALENGLQALIGAGLEFEGPLTGGFQPRVGVGLARRMIPMQAR